MKKYNSMYLGLCINNDDPQKRGRVQVFIPHIMPALYKGWNEGGKDIEISCVGDNIESALPPEILERLKNILPWAEAAAPIFGTSAPGNLQSSPSGSGTFYNQSPVSNPPVASGGGGPLGGGITGNTNFAALAARAAGEGVNYSGSRRLCGIGTRRMVGALLGDTRFNVGMGGNASSCAIGGASGRGTTNNFYQNTGYYSPPAAVGSSYLNDPSQWKIGDVIAARNVGSAGPGHQQVYIGNGKWVSDFNQGAKILPNYTGFTLHRLNSVGIARLTGSNNVTDISATTTSSLSSELLYTSMSDQTAAGANPHMSPQGAPTMTETGTNQYGVNADPTTGQAANFAANATPTIGGQNLSSLGISPGALEYAMRTAAAESGAGINPGNQTAAYVNNINNTIAMSQGIPNGYEVRGVSFSRINQIASEIQSRGLLKPNRLDIGYTQHNADDMRAYGLQNYGSYRDQVLSLARHVQNQANKNPTFAAALKDRQFGLAESLNGGEIVPGWNNSFYTENHLKNKNALSNLIESQYNGNVEAALADLSTKYPDTPRLEELLAGAGSETIPGGDTAPINAASLGINTNLVNNTNSYGAVAQVNVNNMAKGLFSYPAAGAMLWCFFREGNPLYPVYFGVSYSAAEWSSAYRTGSPGIGYNPNPQDGSPISTGGALNLNGVGGIQWTNTTNPLDSSKDERVITFFGEDGSNLFFGAGLTQFYSKFNRRDQVDGDRWQTTLGQKEEWVQGDSNTVVMGDLIVKVGNVGQPAVDAVTRIQEIIKEIQKPLTESS